MASLKKGDGAASQHATNKQFGKGPGAGPGSMGAQTSKSYEGGNDGNRAQPHLKEAQPHTKKVSHPPKINEGTGGQADGAKRIIATEASPKKSSSMFTAPRKDTGGSPIETGYTKLGKV